MTWDIVARHGADEIKDLLDSFLQPSGFGAIELDEALPVKLESEAYIEALVTFTTAVGSGRGVLRLLPNQEGRWKAWTISTALEDLTAYPAHEVTIAGLQDDKFNVAATPGARAARVEDAARRADFIDRDPSVLIIGAGHCGLFLAARLRHLGISALVVEAHERVGDNWRNRYSGLVLHEPKWSSQFPYMMFPDGWPLLTPRDLLADWMEAYGELRTTFRHCGHENLWFVAGGFRDARIHSKHVALMIAAIEGGLLDRKVGEANKAAEA